GPISRIRLSDKESSFRPREFAGQRLKPHEPQDAVQVRIRKARPPLSLYLVLDTQPLPEPPARVGVHGAVGLADRTETEVVGPANQKTVQPGYPILHVQQRPSPTGHRADLLAESRDFLRRRPRADVAFARLRRMTAADGV